MSVAAKPSRVLMTTDAVGGVWTYALELAVATQAFDVSYTLACLGPEPSEAQRREAAAVPNLRLEVLGGKLEWMPDAWDSVEEHARALCALESDVRPNLVHLNSFSVGSAGFAAPVLMVGHSCVLSWWRACKGEEAGTEWDAYRRRVQQGISAADCFVAPTQSMLEEFGRLYDMDCWRQAIPNGRRVPLGPEAEKRPLIAAVGRLWDEAKNISVVADAAKDFEWPCVVAGSPAAPDGDATEWTNVELCGVLAQDDVWRLLQSATIYVHPASYEPFGLAPLEAAAAGCALVLGDIPSLRELWNGAALFVQPRDGDALRRGVEQLIGDEEYRLEIAHRARSRARAYGAARFGASYVEVYDHLRHAAAARVPRGHR